jgi:hypothetical protein
MKKYIPLVDKIDMTTKNRGMTERKDKLSYKDSPSGFLDHLNETFSHRQSNFNESQLSQRNLSIAELPYN